MNPGFDFDLPASGKIIFAEDFDRAPGLSAALEPEVIEPTFSAAELEAARAEAFEAGSAAATAAAATADGAQICHAVTAIADRLDAARDELLSHAEQAASAIARLLLGGLGTVLPALATHYGDAEVRAVIRAVLPGLFKEPAVTLRINPLHAAAAGDEIEHLDPDLAARVRIVPTDAVPAGDVRIAWRNGSATRDAAALWQQVVEALGLAGLAPRCTETTEHATTTEHADTRELEHA